MFVVLSFTASAQAPQFKSGVDMITIDVQVVGADGEPVLGLGAADFEVTIDGRRRPVASVQFLEQVARSRFIGARPQPDDPAPDAAAAGRAPDGRIFMLAVDENSFWPAHARAANAAARLFIDRLAPEDYVGLATLPTSARRMAPTRDHFEVREALDAIVGLKGLPMPGVTPLSTSEVFDITARDADALARVIARECHPTDRTCTRRIQADAAMLAEEMTQTAQASLTALRDLVDGLKDADGRKTIVLISGGLPTSDRLGGGPNLRLETTELGRRAAAASTNLYVLHLDHSFAEAFSARSGAVPPTLMRDSAAFHAGLGLLAGAAGGQLFQVMTEADAAFDRVLRETSAYYLLAIAPLEAERDGKPRRVTVTVPKRSAQVRSRNTVTVPHR